MRFELRKILSSRIVIALTALLLVTTFVYFGYFTGLFSNAGAYEYKRNDEIYREFSGSLTEDKYMRMQALGYESNAAVNLRGLARYIRQYDESCAAKLRSAQRIKAENAAADSKDMYTERLADKVISQYANRQELMLIDETAITKFTITQDYSGKYVSFFLVFICIIVSAELVCSETRSGVYKLNFTSKNGRIHLYANKLAALFVFSGVLTILYTAIQFLAVALKYDMSVLGEPIQYCISFLNCPYEINLLQYIIIICSIRILCCWLICVLSVLAAVVFDNLPVASVLSGAVCVIPSILLFSTLRDNCANMIFPTKYSLNRALMRYSPLSILNPQGHFVMSDYLDFFGYPISALAVNIMVTIALIVVMTVFGGYIFSRKRR